MRGAASALVRVPVLFCLIVLATGILLLAGCTATAPAGGQGSQPATGSVTTPAGIPPYMVHVAGSENRGAIILVGRSTCPWCQKTKALLANMSVDYYWVDLNILDQAETAEVMSSLKICNDTSAVPILVINGQTCIIGYQEEKIRQAVT